MQPTSDIPANYTANEALVSIALAIQNAFGSGALRLGKQSNFASVSINTTGVQLFTTMNITVVGAKTIRVYVHCANMIGPAPATDRVRMDVVIDGAVAGRVYSGAANVAGRLLECDIPVTNGSHTIQIAAVKDVGAGAVSFYADGAGATSYVIAEVVN